MRQCRNLKGMIRMNKKVVIIGAGGHGKVIADIVEKSGDTVFGFLDDGKAKGEKIMGCYCIIGSIEECEVWQKNDEDLYFIIGIGNGKIRKAIFEKYQLNYYTAVHPSANLAMEVTLGEGTVVMANVCVNANAKIGKNCILNTASVIEHDSILMDFVHVCPNATLCGTVKIGNLTQIGAGAVVKNNVEIVDSCTIGAGTVVVKNIEEKGTYVGVPARKIL